MEKKITTPVTKGLLLSLVLIVIGVILHLTGQSMNKGLAYSQYLVILAGVIWGCITYANQLDNHVTFGNVFAHGFKITAVTTVIIIIYTIIAVKLLFPEIVGQALDQATAEMQKRNMPDEQMEKAMAMTKKFFIPFMIAGILVGFLIIGAISSLIGAAVAKKNPQTPFAEQVN